MYQYHLVNQKTNRAFRDMYHEVSADSNGFNVTWDDGSFIDGALGYCFPNVTEAMTISHIIEIMIGVITDIRVSEDGEPMQLP